jgi:hypothetical protein
MGLVQQRINIDQQDINEIKSAVGYPLVQTLDYGDQTDHFIINNIVSKVLRVYFSYFPIKTDTNTNISGSFEVSYPNTDVYRMLRYFFNYKSMNYEQFSPFTLQSMIISKSPAFEGYEHGHLREALQRMTTEEAIADFTKAVRINDDPHNRKVSGYTNIRGDITIEWANKSGDFNKILFNHKEDAIKLASAYFIQNLYRLREQAKVQTKVEINTAALKEDADKWETEVNAKWRSRGFPVLVKN